MTVKELIEVLADIDENAEILAEEKITGDEFPFEELMSYYYNNDTIVFYQR